jgi:selenium-binding protein 1
MAALLAGLLGSSAIADETCLSPYMAKIVGQEEFVYVWTLGMEGLGDGQDKLVTIDSRPASSTYGQVIHSLSVGGRNEAHHSGLTDDRRYLWGGGLDTSKVSSSSTSTPIRLDQRCTRLSATSSRLRAVS